MATLLLLAHAPTESVRRLVAAARAGAEHPDITGVDVVERPALEASADYVLAADALLLATPANFGYMSGALKHFFDATFLQIGGSLADDGSAGGAGPGGAGSLPFGLLVHGRYDTEGAVRSVLSIAGALPWRRAAPVLEVLGEVTDAHVEAAYELGATLAALVSA